MEQRLTVRDRRLIKEVAKVHHHISEELTRVGGRLTEEAAKLRTELAATRADPIKGLFLFSIGQATVLVSLVSFFTLDAEAPTSKNTNGS